MVKRKRDKNVDNTYRERHEVLELFDRLNPKDQLNTLMYLLEMPEEHQPSSTLSIAQRKDRILDYYAETPNGLQELVGKLLYLIERQKDSKEIKIKPSTGCKHNLPHRNVYFTGRDEILKRLHGDLSSSGKTALTQAISGLGGIGKTQTALEYAYTTRDKYSYIFWTRADDTSSLIAGFIDMAELLELREKNSKDLNEAVQAVKRWLESNDGWLMVMDNADRPEQVKPFLPPDHNGRILITSRAQNLDVVGILRPIEMGVMPLDEAVRFLFNRARREDNDANEKDMAAALAKRLGCLPLALEQAGAYIKATGAKFESYLAGYEDWRSKFNRYRPTATDYPESVATTWEVNFQEVERGSEASADILCLSAFVSPDNIPFELISKGAKRSTKALSIALAGVEHDELQLNELMEWLTRYSLIRVEAQTKSYSIHRLVQEVIKDRLSAVKSFFGLLRKDTRRLWAEKAVRVINESFPSVEYDNWPMCKKLLPHAKEAAKLIDNLGFEFNEAAGLLNHAGYYCIETAQYEDAESLFKRALAIKEKVLGPYHPDTATSLNDFALLYTYQGKYEEAEPLYKRALAIWEKALGPDNPNTANSLNNLALLYHNQRKYEEAEPLYKRALAICEKVLGPYHPDTATSLNNLASFYDNQLKYEEAEPLYKRALAIWEKALDPDNPNTAAGLNNLALLYNNQGKYEEAEPMLRRAMAIREKVLDSDHPDTATSFNNLALLYNNQGKYKEAEPLYKKALKIMVKTLGEKHPNTTRILKNYSKLLSAMGRNNEAKLMMERAEGTENRNR
jgi:tetratricopeptide (TPR) repeat protein